MKKRQKKIQETFLDSEESVLKELETVYNQSFDDILKKSEKLQKEIEGLLEIEKVMNGEIDERLQSMIRSKVYQKQYQDLLKGQVSGILDKLHDNEYKAVSEYLSDCYENGFLGTMYDLHGQGVLLMFPLDQQAVTRAVQLDSKISKGLYGHMGEDVSKLKKVIAGEISRGIANGSDFSQIAQQISSRMVGAYKNPGGSLAYAERIAVTEGHRVQVQSAMDACYKARDMGAEIVKQWDSTLDSKTRESHVHVDGEIRELDEKFSNGLMFPGDPSGGAGEVIRCRCALLQQARWILESGFTKRNGFSSELESFESPPAYEEFKKAYFSKENMQYMKYVESLEEKYQIRDFGKLLDTMSDSEYDKYSRLLDKTPMYKKKSRAKPVEDVDIFAKNDKIVSGAVSGARNPYGEKATKHAQKYYGLVRSMKTDVERISEATGMSIDDIQSIKNFIFLEKHDLGGDELEYFYPDYMMSESWRRLILGKPEPHDITMLKHERMEKDLMKKGLSQSEAHTKAAAKYNYDKEAIEYYDKIGAFEKK